MWLQDNDKFARRLQARKLLASLFLQASCKVQFSKLSIARWLQGWPCNAITSLQDGCKLTNLCLPCNHLVRFKIQNWALQDDCKANLARQSQVFKTIASSQTSVFCSKLTLQACIHLARCRNQRFFIKIWQKFSNFFRLRRAFT